MLFDSFPSSVLYHWQFTLGSVLSVVCIQTLIYGYHYLVDQRPITLVLMMINSC